jgi:hypothetical protein
MRHKRHALKVLGLAVMAALAISALASVTAASASTWTVEGGTVPQEVSATLKEGTTAKLEGTLLGQEFILTASALSSMAWEGEAGDAVIYQEGAVAKAKGRLSFSGLTVHKPATCTVTSPIVTKNLTAEVVDHTGSGNGFVKFTPETGAGTTFANIVVKGCPVAGTYPVKGTVYGEGNAWGTMATSQPLNFSPAINTTLGGSLTLGVNAAKLTAEGVNHLTSDKKFGADT